MGIAKPAVVLQYLLETLLIAVPASLWLMYAVGRLRVPGNTVWENGRKCDCHARAFCIGDSCGWHPSDHGSAAVWYSGDAFEAETDLIPDGIKETRYEPQNKFRNTSGFTYRQKVEKDAITIFPACFYRNFGVVRDGDCRCTRRTVGRTAGRDRSQFYCQCQQRLYLQPVTDEMIEEIAAIDGVESYNTSHWTIVNLYHQDTLMKGTDEREYVADLFYGTGCFDSEYSPLFLSGALRLTEGCHVTEGNSGIILYEGLAEKYGLSLGDTLEIKNGNPDDPLVECEIAGLFEVIADDDDEQATMAKPSTLYDYENYIFTDMDTMSAVFCALYGQQWKWNYFR